MGEKDDRFLLSGTVKERSDEAMFIEVNGIGLGL